MKQSGFTVAGFETFATVISLFMKNETFRNHFTKEQVSNFLYYTSNRFLHSFGQNFVKRKKFSNYNKQVADTLQRCRDIGVFDKSLFYVDSGGFQISVGQLDTNQTNILFDLYYSFLQEYSSYFDRAFILDIVPGPGCKIFNTFQDVYDYNMKSYSLAKTLPQECKDKIIYIHHFRTPMLWKIFTKILNEDGMFSSFSHFATGGIVANMKSDVLIPCIIYVIPLIPILIKAKENNITEIDFHILGGANYRDILFYELIKKQVLENHGIKLTITYDSSGLFKAFMNGRYLSTLEGDLAKKLVLRESELHLRWKDNITREDKFRNDINEMCNIFGFGPLTQENIYNKETNTFYRETSVYGMFYMLYMYSRIEELCRQKALDAYECYNNNDIEKFDMIVERTIRNLNQGKITKKQTVKSYCTLNSMRMIEQLDLDYCDYLINKILSSDEFTDLNSTKSVLKF